MMSPTEKSSRLHRNCREADAFSRMTAAVQRAEEITRASKSNLALAFVALPRECRRDMNVFYAFCRIVDDLADEPEPPLEERRAALQCWREAICHPVPGESALAPAVRELIEKHDLDTDLFREIIAGCEMDLQGARYETWDDLRVYCYRVASAVGLISIEIFGYRDPAARSYAVSLGLALQITNILRDIAEDYARDGRIYLPREEMDRFGYTEAELAQHRHTPEFVALMRFQAERARAFYTEAQAAFPQQDRRSLVAAEIMRGIYSRVLSEMERDDFRVFDRRYALGKARKLLVIGGAIVRNL
jgi:phytoene synthase